MSHIHHDHSSHHHHAGEQGTRAFTAAAPHYSLLRISMMERVAIASLCCALLWAAVYSILG